jgi:hypothetical protein
MEENLYAPPKAVVADAGWIKNGKDVCFFAVSPLKLVVLSVCTLGFYQVYWFYKHWVLTPDHDKNARFTGWNWLAIVGGGIFIGLLVLGLAQTVRPQR